MTLKKIILICALLFVLPAPAEAALKLSKKSDMLTLAAVSNPVPAADDILLPMPGGLQMAFKGVCVPAAGYLDSIETEHGVASAQDSADIGPGGFGAYADYAHTVTLSAGYEPSDFPASWGDAPLKEILSAPGCGASSGSGGSGVKPYIYFIGKYEVSRAQWRAVMEAESETPFALREDDYLPQTEVSWFDVIDFTRRYSEWLMQHHPEYLPVFSQERNRPSYIRLPSETEWEFAARGGHKVDPVERSRTRFHPVAEGSDIKDHISALFFDQTLSRPAPIGARKPNPLGLYDMLGNSAEIIFSPFQMVSGGKATGGIGGLIFKGGSWRASDADSLHPGRRVESAYYVEGKAMRRDDIGFRAAIGSILTPKDRWAALNAEWADKSRPKAAKADPKRDDVRILIKEVVREVEDPKLRQRLLEAEAVASLYNQKVNENEERMMRENLLGALFSLETVANYSVRCFGIVKARETSLLLMEQEKTPEQEAQLAKADKEIKGYVEGIHGAVFYYQGMLKQLSGFEYASLKVQLDKISLQFVDSGNGFSRSMTRRVAVLGKHLAGQQAPSENAVLGDMLPPRLFEKLSPYLNRQ